MAHLAGLKRLQRLCVGGGLVTDKGLSYLSDITALNHLTITGDFSGEGLRQLDDLNELRYLVINSEQGVSALTEQHLRRSLPNLYSLNAKLAGFGGCGE